MQNRGPRERRHSRDFGKRHARDSRRSLKKKGNIEHHFFKRPRTAGASGLGERPAAEGPATALSPCPEAAWARSRRRRRQTAQGRGARVRRHPFPLAAPARKTAGGNPTHVCRGAPRGASGGRRSLARRGRASYRPLPVPEGRIGSGQPPTSPNRIGQRRAGTWHPFPPAAPAREPAGGSLVRRGIASYRPMPVPEGCMGNGQPPTTPKPHWAVAQWHLAPFPAGCARARAGGGRRPPRRRREMTRVAENYRLPVANGSATARRPRPKAA